MKTKPTKQSTPKKRKRSIAAADMRRICVDAECEPRTVERYLNGIGTTQLLKRERIERALRSLHGGKYAYLIRKDSTPTTTK